MKRTFYILFSFLLIELDSFLFAEKYITYWASGQLGDQILEYCLTKWVSVKYNIPFFYRAYEWMKFLILHQEEMIYEQITQEQKIKIKTVVEFNESILAKNDTFYFLKPYSYDTSWKKYDKTIQRSIINIHNIPISKKSESLERVDLLKIDCDQSVVLDNRKYNYLYYAIREDIVFLNKLKKLITPRVPLNLVALPKGKITIAIHIREGGKYEKDNLRFPNEISLRVPSHMYYIEQLIRISAILSDQPLFVYIFTNHENPRILIEKFKKYIKNSNITFACRAQSSSENVLDDLFSMIKFDCLIRPNSAFSKVAQLLGDYKIIIYPMHGVWKNRSLIIDQIGVIIKNNKNIGEKI